MGLSFKGFLRASFLLATAGLLGCGESRLNDRWRAPVPKQQPAAVDSAAAYYIQVELGQDRFSLDPFEHLKDAVNGVDFYLPVSAKKYRTLERGNNLVDDFRAGSAILNGSFSATKLKVTEVPVVSTKADTTSYDVTLTLGQSRLSLDPFKHLKDALNEVEFKWDVPGEVYNNLNVGDDLIEGGFRVGSFLMQGSTSSWHLKVVRKNGPTPGK